MQLRASGSKPKGQNKERDEVLQATDVIEKPKQEVKGDLEKENATCLDRG